MVSRVHRVERMQLEDEQHILIVSRTHETTLDWLYSQGLLVEEADCPNVNCNDHQLRKIKDPYTADIQKLRCSNCRTSRSLRWQSFFHDHKLTLMECIQVAFYHFIRQTQIKTVSKEMKISERAVSRLYSEVRTIISLYMEDLKVGRQLGIETDDNGDAIVEIDETLMTHQNGLQMWVLGIFDRVTKDFWCWPVPDRTVETLIPIITQHVGQNARIYTDGWQSYTRLSREGYDHRVVPHVNGFGSGENTTNGIESCWSELKRLTHHSHGIQVNANDPIASLQQYVNVGCWRRQFKNEDLCRSLIEILTHYYST